MRVPPPSSLKLDREELLRDVRDRIAERLPNYGPDNEPDPTDPGWILLEQSAWLVEVLSGQLDRYPYAVLQQLMHVIGGELLPAKPACGVVVASVGRGGTVAADPKGPGEFRFMTPPNENQDTIEFVSAEPAVYLSKGRFASVVSWDGSELSLAADERADSEGSLPGTVAWYREQGKSGLFQYEVVEYTVATNRPEDTVKEFEQAIKMFDARNIGWLTLAVEPQGKDRVLMTARIDLGRPFARTVPGGITTGGDVYADWGVLDDSTWTPTVTVRKHALLPRGIRGMRPMPGMEEGQIAIPDVPMNFPTDQLLVRNAAPMPTDVVDAIWATLGNLNTRLASLKPRVRRKFPIDGEATVEPTWVGAALQSGVWRTMTGPEASTIAHLDEIDVAGKESIRVAIVVDPSSGRSAPGTTFFEVTPEGVVPASPLKATQVWRLPGVLPIGQGTPVEVVAWDVETAGSKGLIAVQRGPTHAFLHNAILVANMPAVRDGRSVLVQRNVPEPVSLLNEDVVTQQTIEHLLKDPVPRRAAAALRKLPLARFSIEEADEDDIVDWAGVRIDGSSGQMTINAPDAVGKQRDLRPGLRIDLDWYRRTDGVWGNVPAGTINLSEQAPNSLPSIETVTNPLGTVFGADREDPKAAVDRLFAPAGGLPVLPSDFEARFRQALGQRADGWVIRVWSYAERALYSTALWPFDKGASKGDPNSAELLEALEHADPSTLLVIVGPADGQLADLDFQAARAVIEKNVEDLKERMAAVRGVVVGRFWPLTLEVDEATEDTTLPCFDTTGLEGELVDARGRRAKPPVDTLLLNAAVTKVVEKEDEWA